MKYFQVAILGAGPIGIEAALACLDRGWDVRIYEQGCVGDNIKQWGHVRLFSPFKLNHSPRGAERLLNRGVILPADDALLNGRDFISEYLSPLAQLPEFQKILELNTTVCHISRDFQLKGDHVGNELRAARPFRILIESNGKEETVTADFVLDCTGTFGHHNWLGRGGIPCPGEKQLANRIRYNLPDLLNCDRSIYAGTCTLVIGSGYSAATNIVSLAELQREDSSTVAYWVTRKSAGTPLAKIPDDLLKEREQLTRKANRLACKDSCVNWIPGAVIDSMTLDEKSNQINVSLTSVCNGTTQVISVDNVLANVGTHPDRSIYHELQIHECYATHGPMKLAAALMGETSVDCLAQSTPGAGALINPEPNFFILGAKSYGRSSQFLLKIGLEQIDQVAELISKSL